MALDSVRHELELGEIPYIKSGLHANYNYKSINTGSKQGWLVSAKLKVPETFESGTIFIEIPDPESFINIPDVLWTTLEVLLQGNRFLYRPSTYITQRLLTGIFLSGWTQGKVMEIVIYITISILILDIALIKRRMLTNVETSDSYHAQYTLRRRDDYLVLFDHDALSCRFFYDAFSGMRLRHQMTGDTDDGRLVRSPADRMYTGKDH